MKKTYLIAILLVLTAFVFNGCSKKGANSIIGSWKMDTTPEMESAGMKFDVVYEFTKEKMKMNVSMNGQAQPSMEFVYKVKSEDGATVVLEVEHPESKQKGDFKIKIEGSKMNMTDPDGKVSNLTKQ
jgi:hypothetical protein